MPASEFRDGNIFHSAYKRGYGTLNDWDNLKSSDAAGFKMPNLVFKKFLMPYLLHASWLTFFIVSQCRADIPAESNTFRIKTSLVAWLISTSESDEDFISDNLVLNRGLEKKGCPFPITFTFAATNKRLVKAECGDTWRRFIKIPPRVKFKPFDEVDPILAESQPFSL